jgi:hypothetical protein
MRSLLSDKLNKMEIPLTEEEFAKRMERYPNTLIQDLFPELTPDQREFILTGITKEEWDETFTDD